MFTANSVRCLSQTSVLLVLCEQREGNCREPSPGCIVGDQTHRTWCKKCVLLQLQCATDNDYEEGQCLMTTFLFVCSEFPSLTFKSHRITARTLHLTEDCIIPCMFTCSLRAQNWRLRPDANDGHNRYTVQHICAQCHRIFTMWFSFHQLDLEEKIVLIYIFFFSYIYI